MAIRDWHWGQLLIMWLAYFLVLFIFSAVSEVSGLERRELPTWLRVLFLVLFLASLFVPLLISWHWFAGQRRNDRA